MKNTLNNKNMNKLIWVVIIGAFVFYKYYNYNKYVKIENGQVVITDFQWQGSGASPYYDIYGDFDTLDKEMYRVLSDKSGVWEVVCKGTTKDNYGTDQNYSYPLGDINADDLKKYQSEKYWKEGGGAMTLFQNYMRKK
jgi:hypothetical protein